MTLQAKTAADLPSGAQVETFFAVITKHGPDQWTNRLGDPFTDAEVDEVIARGGMLTFIPTGCGRQVKEPS